MGDRAGRRAGAAVAVALLLGALGAGAAAAQTLTDAQLRGLAAQAVDDPRALARLRAVREVDGRPIDVGGALSGAEGPVLTSRLRALADGGDPAGAVAPDVARRDAETVLESRRFHASRVPRPLAGVLTTLGRWLKPVGDPLRRIWSTIAESLGAQIVVVVAVFVVSAAVSVRLVGRRSPRALGRPGPFGVDTEGLDPDALDREAAVAESIGDFDRAVRLRFVAGVLRLDRAGAVAYRSSMTTGQLKAALRSAPFAELAGAFDEIAYGGRPAAESDVQAARATWPRVLAEARR